MWLQKGIKKEFESEIINKLYSHKIL